MVKQLLSMGEILFDFLPINEGGETIGFRLAPGGGPFNVAVGLARLDRPTGFISKLSNDYFGRRLRNYLRSQGINDELVAEDPSAPTTLAFIANENGEPYFTFYGDNTADTRMSVEDLPADLEQRAQVLHIGGISLLRGSTPQAVLAATKRLQGKALISFDPNVRPALIDNHKSYRATIDQLVSRTDLLKLSAADLAWLAPGHAPEQAAIAALNFGPALIALTLGGEGAIALRASPYGVERVHVPVVKVKVADTVGAGDSFTAALLGALAEHGALDRTALRNLPTKKLEACLHFAATAAAITCSRVGADPPTRAEVVEAL